MDITLLILVYTVGHWVWRNGVALRTASWHVAQDHSGLHLTLPGYWYGFVSVPIAQFIVFRWDVRLYIWFLLLWRISRLDLRLQPAHPDCAGGLGFVGRSGFAFALILFAQGALLSGVIASRAIYEGQSVTSFRLSIVALVVLFVIFVLEWLMVFMPALAAAKRRGKGGHGTLASAYVADFDKKWLERKGKGEAILGSEDIQSLADLGRSVCSRARDAGRAVLT